MVLIDSTGSALPASASAQSWGPGGILARASVLASTLGRLGVGRLIGLGGGYGTLPPHSAAEVRAKTATSASLRSTIDEFLQASASEHEAAAPTAFGDKPLVVLTAGHTLPSLPGRKHLHAAPDSPVIPTRLRGFIRMDREQAPAPS